MGFANLGWWSDMLAAAAMKSDRIEIAACTSRSQDKCATFAARFGGRAIPDLQSLLEDDGVDAVVLTPPNSLHAEQCIRAARFGKHIFIEKPMALTVQDCQRIIAAAAQAGVVLAVGLNKRRMPWYRKAHEMVQAGRLGTVVLAEAISSGDLGLTMTPDNWRWYREESPGGPLTSYTVHHADVINHMFGVPRQATAFSRRVCAPTEADDVVAACIEFETGALAYLGGTLVSPARKVFQVHGTDGVISIDEDMDFLTLHRRGASDAERIMLPAPAAQRAASLVEEMHEFAVSIQDGKPPEIGGQQGLEAVAVIEAIVRSSELGRPVTLRSLGLEPTRNVPESAQQ